MTDQHRGIPQRHKPDKQQHDRNTRDDIRIQHRNIRDRRDHGLRPLAHHRHTDAGQRTEDRSDQRCRCRQKQRRLHGMDHFLILKQLDIPVECKTAPDRTRL